MLGNSQDNETYRFKPNDRVRIKIDGGTRPAIISRGYYSSSKGKVCYSGRYLDNNQEECFIEILEVLILDKETTK